MSNKPEPITFEAFWQEYNGDKVGLDKTSSRLAWVVRDPEVAERDKRIAAALAIVGTQTDCQCQGEHDCIACQVRAALTEGGGQVKP